jgi:hypothetical protein
VLDLRIFVERPLAAALLACVVLSLAVPAVNAIRGRLMRKMMG